MYAMANETISEPISVISYDSPIEVAMPFAQVDYRDNEEELLNYVRLAKKQDVDIAYLNEIPTKNVAFAIKDLVNSSVYVITTMHLDRIWHLPYRLKEYYGESYKDIITQINGVVNQKMFSVLCPNCRKQTLISSAKYSEHYEFLKEHSASRIYTSAGCHMCNDTVTGTSGIVIGKNQPIVEHIVFTDEIKDELLKCTEAYEMESVIKKFVKDKHQALEDYMIRAIEDGVISSDSLQQII
jgi:type II secretory ATPase GspE/PulE/Tfp pilus assembly ATPase PilB-like protein